MAVEASRDCVPFTATVGRFTKHREPAYRPTADMRDVANLRDELRTILIAQVTTFAIGGDCLVAMPANSNLHGVK